MRGIGDNSQAVDPIKSLVERIENLEAEKKSLAEDIRSVYAEAKDKGENVKALRTVIGQRRTERQKRLEHEAACEDIERRLGMR